jgi:AcrR family transcriptional regulator
MRADSATQPAAPSQAASKKEVKRAATKAQIMHAAARIIGRYGYASCSVARIAAKAKIAHGTFYLYFSSQQELFDELLPAMSDENLAAVGTAVKNATSLLDMEEKGLRANLAYLKKHPYLWRVTSEAQIYAPKAFERYYEEVHRRYSRALMRICNVDPSSAGEEEKHLFHAIAVILEGARDRLFRRYGIENGKFAGISEADISLYLQFTVGGLNHVFEGR